jgi:hypothetical protein
MKRIILLHTAGDYPGLRMICGRWPDADVYPERLPPFQVHDRYVAGAVLVGTRANWMLYREEA